MKLKIALLCALAVLSAWVCVAQPYYVSPDGNDQNPGTLKKPFATLQRAQQAVRQKHGDVFLRGGTYYLPRRLCSQPKIPAQNARRWCFKIIGMKSRSSAAA